MAVRAVGRISHQSRTLIGHAAASGAISAAPLGMHLPPTFACLVAAPGLPLPAMPHLRGTRATAVDLTAVASATDNNLLATIEAKKKSRTWAFFAAGTIWLSLWRHSF